VSVAEAADGAVLGPGQAVIAPGGDRHLEVVGRPDGSLRCQLVAGPPENGHCPSADRLFRSAARAVRARAVGVILTRLGARRSAWNA
ncbi:MAG TPA: chemotaxis protein CheB, partial [Paracoccus sp. (in: a-proteobacteria)]|nr:chemotaxis protein CheB [Paracoccus sp. (in: a-proteobacteria)]